MKKTISVFLAAILMVMSFFGAGPQGIALADGSGGGTTYYVSTEGDDGNSGTSDAPFKTFAKGVSQLQPGDTMLIKAGDYSEALVLNGLKGSAEAPITIRGEAGTNITAGAYVNAPFWKNFTLSVANSEYVNISNIRFTFSGTPETGDSYTVGVSGAKSVKLQNNHFAAGGPAYAVFYLDTNNENLILDGNYVEGSDNAFYGYGIHDTTITNNIFTQWWTFHFESSTSTHNTISNNVFAGAGEHFYGGTYENSIITNNIFLGNPKMGLGTGNTVGYNSVTDGSLKTSATDVVGTAADTFVSATDYHLKEGSPSIDAGTEIGLPPVDRDGKTRIGPADIGAYTYGKFFYLDASAPAGGDGLSEASAFNNLADAVAAIIPGATLLIKSGSYTGNLAITGTGAADTKSITIQKLGDGVASIDGGAGPAITLKDIANVNIAGLTLASRGNTALLVDGAIHSDISNSTVTSATYGIEITGHTQGSKFHNLTFQQPDQTGILLKDSTGNEIYNNIFDNTQGILNEGGSFTDTRIMNNVMISHGGDGANIVLKGTNNTGNTIANNIFRAEGPAAIATATSAAYFNEPGTNNIVDHNLYDSTSTGLSNGAPENEPHSVYGDPKFVGDSDYHLQLGSAAIDKGTNVNAPALDRDGRNRFGATDIGAYEYVGGNSTAFRVVGQSPQGNGIKTDSVITVTLSEKTNDNQGNISSNISVTTVVDRKTVNVPGSFTTADEGEGTKITFTPAAKLNYDSTYTVTVKKDLMSTNGNYLPADVSWQFSTEAFIMNEYYISPNGSDSNLGTIDSPKKTVSSSLIAKLKAGDTVYFREGTYNGIIVLQTFSGTADKPITFKSYQNEKVVLTSDHPEYIIYLGHSQHIRIEGLTFAPNASQNGSRGTALRIDNHTKGRQASSDIVVTRNRFENCGTAIATRDLVNVGFGDFEFSNNVILSDDGWGLYFQEVREQPGSYGKIFNNVIYGANRSLNLWGKSSNLLFYNNTFADTYDPAGGSGRYDLYPVQGTYDSAANPINISTDLVFKNNIFTKPIRTQLEGGKSIIDAAQNVVFDHNVYSISGTQRVTYNGGGEGPVLTLAQLQSGTAWANQGRPLETNGKFGDVAFVNVQNDARIIFPTNPAIGTATTTIIPGVEAPATDINGNARAKNEAGAYAYDETFAFVGKNTGPADGSPLHPYPSIEAAVKAGAKSIQVMAGSYDADETIDMAASTGGGDVKVMPYNGEVTLSGAVSIKGTADKAISIERLTLAGNVTLSGKKVTVSGNRIQGVLAMGQADGAVVTGNVFAPKAADAIQLSGSVNSLITNNVISERETAIRFAASSTANKIYNNTLYGNGQDAVFSGDSTGNIFKNNIFSTRLSSYANNEFDYNLYNADTIAKADLDAITADAHAVKAAAGFINAKAKDYRLYKGSPAVGAGIKDEFTPGKDMNGIARKNPPDIGAYAAVAVDVSYYVDAVNGDDSSAGTAEAPFKTIGAALKALRNGETVVVKAGTYRENISLADRAGSEADSYVIKADGAVILEGSVTLDGTTGVTINGFTVNAGEGNTAVTVKASPKAALKNLTISQAKTGISALDSPELTLSKVNISQVEKGIALDGAGKVSPVTVSQTKVDQASGTAIEASNQVVLNLTSSLITHSGKGVVGAGKSRFTLMNNTFYDNSGYSVQISGAEGNGDNPIIANNIFSRSARGQGAFVSVDTSGSFYANYNLYDAAADEDIIQLNGSGLSLEEASADGTETKGLLGAPMFKNASTGDFSLAKGSLVARKGTKSINVKAADDSQKELPAPSTDYAGTPYSALGQDIGAYYSPYSMRTLHLAGDNVGQLDGDGSAEHPFRTFAQAINAADSGDTIIVHKGIYKGRYDINNKHGAPDAPIIIKASTNPNDPLDLVNAALPGPIFTGKTNYEDRNEEAKDEVMTKITNSSYLTFEGLNITGFRGAGIWAMDSDHLVLKNLKIWDIDTPQDITSGVEGLLISSTTDSLFKDIQIWDIGQTRKSQADHGAYIGHSSNLVFDGMKISNSPGGGIQFYAGDNYEIQSTDIVIKNSVFSESKYGLILVGIQDFTVTNNTFHNSWENDLYLDWNVRGNLFQNNVFYNDRTKEYDSVYGKVKPVIIGYQYNVIRTNPDQSKTHMVVDNTFRNNLYDYRKFPANAQFVADVMPIEQFMAAENAAETNNRYTNMYNGKMSFKGSFQGAADDYVRAQQIFDNVLDVKSGSASIDKGVSENAPTIDILGRSRVNAPDLGAYEYISGGTDGGGGNGGGNGGNGNGNGNDGGSGDGSGNGNGGGNSSNAGSSNSGENSDTNGTTLVQNGKLDDSGAVHVVITSDQLAGLFGKAKEDTRGTKAITLKVAKVDGAMKYVQKLPIHALTAAKGDKKITIETSIGTLTVPSNMLAPNSIGNAATVELSIGRADKSKLSKELQAQIGDKPVIELNLLVDGKPVAWNNAEAPVTVAMDYALPTYERVDVEYIVVWHVDDQGHVSAVPSGRYDHASGKITFTTTHFSKYAAVFVHKAFKDTAKYTWAEKQMNVLASKGIINGTSETTFTPGANVTRADFIKLLVSGLGLTAKVDSNFSDVSPTDYYYEAAGIAKKLGITGGIDGSRLNPRAYITRQDMMVMVHQALITVGKLPEKSETTDVLVGFSDASKITAYATGSVAALVKEGIVKGSDNRINPLGHATRAEIAVLIYTLYNK